MNPSRENNSNRRYAASDRLALAMYLGLLLLALGETQTAFPVGLLQRNMLLGALVGLLLARLGSALFAKRFNWLASDFIFALWLVWELLAPLFARAPFAAAEGLREVLLAAAAYDIGATIIHRRRHLAWALIIIITLSAAVAAMLIPNICLFPALSVPLAALAFFGAVALFKDRQWRAWRRMFFKFSLSLIALGFIAGYMLLAHWQQREVFRGGGAALRLRRQEAFAQEQMAKRLFARNFVRGVGRGNFVWHAQALQGTAAGTRTAVALSSIDAQLLTPTPSSWPHLAQLGVVSLGLMMLIYFSALSFSIRLFSQSAAAAEGVQVVSPQNQAARAGLFVWLVTGFLGAFLFTPLGMIVTFTLAGMLRGQRLDWRARAKLAQREDRAVTNESPLPRTAGAADRANSPKNSNPKTKRIFRLFARTAGGAVIMIVFALLLALPEISAWIGLSNEAEMFLEGRTRRIYLAQTIYPLTPEFLLSEVQLLQEQYAGMRVSKIERDRITNLLYQAQGLNPLDERLHLELAAWLRKDLQASAERRQLEQGARDCPGSLAIAYRLADCYERQRNDDQALACLEPFLAQRPGDLELLERAHRLALKLNRRARAEQLDRQIAQLRNWRKWPAGR